MKNWEADTVRCVRLGRRVGPERLSALCRTAVLLALDRPIGVGHDGDPLSLLLAAALVSGIRRAGGHVLLFPEEGGGCRLSCRIAAGRSGAELWFFRGTLPKNAENTGIPCASYWQNP